MPTGEITPKQPNRPADGDASLAVGERLTQHLAHWLGHWPPSSSTIDIVGTRQRTAPSWDATAVPLLGMRTPLGDLLSVPPESAPLVEELVARLAAASEAGPAACAPAGSAAVGSATVADAGAVDVDRVIREMPALLGQPDRRPAWTVFRWCEHPTSLPDAGVWTSANDPAIPPWLRPFGGEVLVTFDPETGAYLAGVGIKRHDGWGREIAVGTQAAARGKGLARRLVAQATRRLLDEGFVATYQHVPTNLASARVADAAGFPDRGWRCVTLD